MTSSPCLLCLSVVCLPPSTHRRALYAENEGRTAEVLTPLAGSPVERPGTILLMSAMARVARWLVCNLAPRMHYGSDAPTVRATRGWRGEQSGFQRYTNRSGGTQQMGDVLAFMGSYRAGRCERRNVPIAGFARADPGFAYLALTTPAPSLPG